MQWLSPRHGRGFVAPRALSSLGRRHVSNPPPPKWFEPLRQEMLNRDLGSTVALLNPRDNETLAVTLEPFIRNSFFPSEAGVPVGNFIFPLGSHLVHFYDVVPTNALLPDGTDKRHSPGGKFKRRLWAGGSMRLDMDKYYSAVRGWASFQRIHAHERIKEVELRGQGASKKLFVTIERRFGAVADLADCGGSASDALAGQTGRGDEWGAASLVEERTLVFLKQRPDETEKLAYGVVKFAKSLGEPHFSRSLTPSPALLFRYSALTFNAHAIHLDPEYARQVEGHPGLLVHGPLSLTFMLALVQAHLEKLPGPRQAIQSIEYRNLAPLYSGIPLRVCAKEKKRPRTKKSRTYDVWIEVKGEMGGMAVKGTIRTSLVPRSADAPTSEGSVSDKPRAVLAAQLNASDAQPESRKTPTKSTPSSHAMEKEAPSDNTSPTLFRHVNSTKRTFWRSILAPPPRSRNALAPLRSRYVLHPLKSKVSRPSSKRSIGGSSLVRRVTSSLSVRPRVQRVTSSLSVRPRVRRLTSSLPVRPRVQRVTSSLSVRPRVRPRVRRIRTFRLVRRINVLQGPRPGYNRYVIGTSSARRVKTQLSPTHDSRPPKSRPSRRRAGSRSGRVPRTPSNTFPRLLVRSYVTARHHTLRYKRFFLLGSRRFYSRPPVRKLAQGLEESRHAKRLALHWGMGWGTIPARRRRK